MPYYYYAILTHHRETLTPEETTSHLTSIIENKFDYVNKKSCELAIKARDISKKNILIAGSLPPQNGTYIEDDREISLIKKDFNEQAKIIRPYVDFLYFDV